MRIVDGKIQEEKEEIKFEVNDLDPAKKNGLNILQAGQLKEIIKPTRIISFIWHQDDSIRFDFIVRKIDPLTTGLLHDTMIVRSLARLQQFAELQDKDVENITPEEFTEMLNVDQKILDSQNADKQLCITASYAIIEPHIPPSEIIHTLTLSMIKVIANWATGGIDQMNDLVDGFRIQTSSP